MGSIHPLLKLIIFPLVLLFIFSGASAGNTFQDRGEEQEQEEEKEKVRVGITLKDDFIEFALEDDDKLTDKSDDFDLELEPGSYKILQNNTKLEIVNESGENKGKFKAPLYLKPDPSSEPYFTIDNAEMGKRYRGQLEISSNSSNSEIIAVNLLDVESYLQGVLPREIPSSWGDQGGMEALKAQAVAARGYTMSSLEQNRHNDYDLCDTQHCQVYGGIGGEHNNTNEAVAATKGQVLKYGEELITPFYHATNAGFSETPQNVWNSDLPYYTSVPDPYDDPQSEKNVVQHRHSSWEEIVPMYKLNEYLLQNDYADVGEVLDLTVRSTFESGRVEELYIQGTEGSESLIRESARWAFDLKSQLFSIKGEAEPEVWVATKGQGEESKHSISSLQGKRVLNASQEKELQGGKFTAVGSENRNTVPYPSYIFQGRGFGHAIGMSQNGAYNRSRAGYNYAEILEFYYPGTEIDELD